MATAVRLESRTVASGTVLRNKAGIQVYLDAKLTKARSLTKTYTLDEFGVPVPAGSGFHYVLIERGQFDNDDDFEGGLALIREEDILDGPRAKTAAELAATAARFAAPSPVDEKAIFNAGVDAAATAAATARRI